MPDPAVPAVDEARELVELRIHGVSGTPPESMLDAHFVSERAGDATTGFYIPDPDVPVPGAEAGDRPRWLEGYSWRGMTSGSPLQALWVLLAPFALANAAAAMRPPGDGHGRGRVTAALYAAAVRLFALSLTLTLVMATFIASVDEVAWQCGNNPQCIGGHSPTRFLSWPGVSSPPRRVALTLLVPLAGIALLWFLARRAWKARAAVLAVVGTRSVDDIATATLRTRLDNPDRWDDREPSEYLRHLHVAAAFAIVTAMAALGLAYPARGSAIGLWVIAIVAFALVGVAALAATVGLGQNLRSSRRIVSVGVLIAAIVLFVVLIVALVADPTIDAVGGVGLAGVEAAVVWLFVAQLFLMLLIGALGFAPVRQNRAHRVALHGIGGALVSGLALVLGAMFSAGIVLRVGDYLGQTTTPLAEKGKAGRVPLIVPNALTWAARGAVFLVVVFAALALVGALGWLLRFVMRSFERVAVSVSDFVHHRPAPVGSDVERSARLRQVKRAEWRAGLTDYAGAILIGPAVISVAIAIATTVIVVQIDRHRFAPEFEIEHSQWIAEHAAAYGGWIITGFAGLLLVTVLRARKNEALRRKVGILWDLTTFWPRHAQPLGPPCYTDRALPEFVSRVTWHFENNRDVVISAHSQGSIIAATAVLQLHEDVRARVAFLTYGSPMQRLFAPWFPAFFNRETFEELGRRLPNRWHNLFRTTDPIGGAIPPGPPTGPVNVKIAPNNVIPDGDFVYPVIRVHSDYPVEPEYRAAVTALDGELRASH